MWIILAQAILAQALAPTPPVTPPPIDYGFAVQALGGVGAFALIAWLIKRVFTHTIPRLAQDFRESLDAQSKILTAELANQRQLFERESDRSRVAFQDAMKSQREEFRTELQREREFFGTQIYRLTQAVQTLELAIARIGQGPYPRKDPE